MDWLSRFFYGRPQYSSGGRVPEQMLTPQELERAAAAMPPLGSPEFREWNAAAIDRHNATVARNLPLLAVPQHAANAAASAGRIGTAAKHGVRRVQLARLGAPERMRNTLYPERLRNVIRKGQKRPDVVEMAGFARLLELMNRYDPRRE